MVVRPRWHDVVIAIGIVTLTAVGIAAIWGDQVRGLVHSWRGGDPAPQVAAPPATR